MQGYDFLYLFQNKGLTLQMGGSDQWGNITTGTELIRRIAGGKAYAMTCPLIAKPMEQNSENPKAETFGLTQKNFALQILSILAKNTSDADVKDTLKFLQC